MKTNHSISLTLAALWLSGAAAAAAVFENGEFLISNFGPGTTAVQRYGVFGNLMQTFSGPGGFWLGAALDPVVGRDIVVTRRDPSPAVDRFDYIGQQSGPFLTGGGSPGDVSYFPDGNFAVNDQDNGTIQLFNRLGFLRTITLPGGAAARPFGSTVGKDSVLYVTGLGPTTVFKVTEGGTILGTLNLGFEPGDIVMDKNDGTLWISERQNNVIAHVTTAGAVLGSFATGLTGTFNGLGIDGQTLYATTDTAGVVRRFGTNGNLVDNFNIIGPITPGFIFVVETPEPGSLTLLALGAAAVLARRRRRS